jgi:ATP-dependent helicase/DNAse subunit B
MVKESSSGIEANEASRYLRQIDVEFNKISQINVHHNSYNPINEKKLNHPRTNTTTLKNIENWMEKGVSPSSIITFTNCPLEFYYRYILKIREDNKPDKFIQASEWGTGIHQTLENLYAQYEIVNIDAVKKMKKDLDKFMDHEFNLIFKDKRHLKGKNTIIYYHFKKCLDHYLKKEINNINKSGSFKVLDLEKEIMFEDEIIINSLPKKIKFKGIIDRIDLTSDGIRLIDYKSGMVQPKELILNNFDQLQQRSKSL